MQGKQTFFRIKLCAKEEDFLFEDEMLSGSLNEFRDNTFLVARKYYPPAMLYRRSLSSV